MVAVTDGRHGAFVGTGNRVIHCSIVPAEVIGTAGAGDAFASTFVALTTMGWPLETALKAAAVNSGAVVGHVDTQSGLMKLAELEETVDKDESLQVREWAM
jgi:sugar/nucleoside kinase (ribokinase family)